MIMCGLKDCNSTVKAKQAVMDVAYYKMLKGSTANVWFEDMDLHWTCYWKSNVFTEYSECVW